MFDLGELEDADIVRAELRLTNNERWSAGTESLDVLVFPVSRQWSGQNLTWLRQPGGSGGPAARTVIRPEHNGMTRVDITELVASWISRSLPNQGVMLRAQPERSGLRAAWYSSEATDVAQRPLLEVQIQ